MNDFDIFLWFRRTTNHVGTSSTQDQSAIMLTVDDFYMKHDRYMKHNRSR